MARRLLLIFVAFLVAGGLAGLFVWKPWQKPRLVADADDAVLVARGRVAYN